MSPGWGRCFGALNQIALSRLPLLSDAAAGRAGLAEALVKAVILGKLDLSSRGMRIANLVTGRPLILTVLCRAAFFTGVVFVLKAGQTVIEDSITHLFEQDVELLYWVCNL